MVNSESDFNENLMKNAKLLLVGVPSDVAGELVDIDFNKDIEIAKSEVLRAYNLNPIVDIQFIFKGKVITELSQLKKLGFNPKKDMITVMASQSAGAYDSREARLEQLIKEGASEDDLIRIAGSRTFLKSYFNKYYDVKTLIEAKAQLLHGFFDENIDNFIDAEEAIYRVQDIQDMSNILQGDVDERLKSLDKICKILYGATYNELLVEKSRIDALRTKIGLKNAWNIIKGHKAFDGTPLINHYEKNTLIGVGKFFKVFDQNGNIIKDNGNNKYDILGLKLGTHKYKAHFGTASGNNLLHIVAGHLNTKGSGFGRIGLKTEKDIAEFLFDIVSTKIGVWIQWKNFPHTIVYKFYSQASGEIEYLVIGLDRNDKSIYTSYLVNKEPSNPIYQYIEGISILNNRDVFFNY